MSLTPNPSELFTPFLPSTFNLPEEEDRVHSYLGDKFSQFSDVINDKKIGTITQATENYNGESWQYRTTKFTRAGYQAIAYIPSYNAVTITLGLTGTPLYPIPQVNNELVITELYGTASKPPSSTGVGDGDYFSFMNRGDARISFTMSDTSIVITTDGTLSAYSGFIFVSYLRNGL